MECAFVAVILLLLVFSPLVRMLSGTGPNSLRQIRRIDLAAFFVLTAGVGLAFGVARAVVQHEGALVFTVIVAIALPMALAAAWFARFVVEDLAFHFGKRRRGFPDVDLSVLEGSIKRDKSTENCMEESAGSDSHRQDE